jgi:hypothetical protein
MSPSPKHVLLAEVIITTICVNKMATQWWGNIRKYAVLGGATVERDVEGCDQSTGLLSVASLSADEDCYHPLYNFFSLYSTSFLFPKNLMFILHS